MPEAIKTVKIASRETVYSWKWAGKSYGWKETEPNEFPVCLGIQGFAFHLIFSQQMKMGRENKRACLRDPKGRSSWQVQWERSNFFRSLCSCSLELSCLLWCVKILQPTKLWDFGEKLLRKNKSFVLHSSL